MNKRPPRRERIPSPSCALACSLALALAACASSPRVEVPDKLRPSANESPTMIVAAKGVQIYECRATDKAASGFDWMFVAPEAELFDARGNRVGRHGAGPFWEAADGSRIVGTLKQRADAPRAGAIPWLLLTSTSVGGEGRLSRVTSVQRINTVGGVAPEAACNTAALGKSTRVPYTADYVFLSP